MEIRIPLLALLISFFQTKKAVRKGKMIKPIFLGKKKSSEILKRAGNFAINPAKSIQIMINLISSLLPQEMDSVS